jgi:hypothetical protein
MAALEQEDYHWDEIQSMYEAGLRNCRDEEDHAAESAFQAKRECLTQQIVTLIQEQGRLENEFEEEKRERARVRKREDEVAKAWFRKYRREPIYKGNGDEAPVEMEEADGMTADSGAPVYRQGEEESAYGQLADAAKGLPDTRCPAEGQEEELRSQPSANAEELPHRRREEETHPAAVMNGHAQEPEQMDVSGDRVLYASQEQQRNLTLEHDVTGPPSPGDGEAMDGIEVIGVPEYPGHGKALEADRESKGRAPKVKEQPGLLALPIDHETQETDAMEPPAPSSTAESPVDTQPGNLPRSGEDIEMSDAQPSTETATGGVGSVERPSQTFLAVPVSPSPSFEFRSRYATPELDNPVSLPKGPSLPIKRPIQIRHAKLRERKGLPHVGRPPARATKTSESSGSSKQGTAPRSLKYKDLHETPGSTPSKLKPTSPSKPTSAAPTAGPQQQQPKKIKIIARHAQADGDARKPKSVLNSPFPPPATPERHPTPSSLLDDDGYTSADSISGYPLQPIEWRLYQVRTRTFATNPEVTQYWHWVADNHKKKEIEHQVLEEVEPTRWGVFKEPYNFHLLLDNVKEVTFAEESTKIILSHRKGRDGKDMNPRGDVMASFKRERTKRRFLSFIEGKGVKVVKAGV